MIQAFWRIYCTHSNPDLRTITCNQCFRPFDWKFQFRSKFTKKTPLSKIYIFFKLNKAKQQIYQTKKSYKNFDSVFCWFDTTCNENSDSAKNRTKKFVFPLTLVISLSNYENLSRTPWLSRLKKIFMTRRYLIF